MFVIKIEYISFGLKGKKLSLHFYVLLFSWSYLLSLCLPLPMLQTSRFLEKLRLLEELRLLQDRLFKEPENNDECRKNGSLKRLNDQSDVCGFRSCFKNHYDSLPNQRCLVSCWSYGFVNYCSLCSCFFFLI